MPTRLPMHPSVQDVQEAVYQWMDLLASEQYGEALDRMAHDPRRGWSALLLKDVINGYGLPWSHVGGMIHTVSDRRITEATETRRYEHVEIYEKPLPVQYRVQGCAFIGSAWFDLPLDGTWSDLTASFDIVRAADHSFLELDTIEVL